MRKDGKGKKYYMEDTVDSPFKVLEAPEDPDKGMSKEEQEQAQADEIVELYKKKDSQHPQIVQHNRKKKTLFDELWERNNPQEAAQLQEKEEQERKEKERKEKQMKLQKE